MSAGPRDWFYQDSSRCETRKQHIKQRAGKPRNSPVGKRGERKNLYCWACGRMFLTRFRFPRQGASQTGPFPQQCSSGGGAGDCGGEPCPPHLLQEASSPKQADLVSLSVSLLHVTGAHFLQNESKTFHQHKIMPHLMAILMLLRWSGTKPEISPVLPFSIL